MLKIAASGLILRTDKNTFQKQIFLIKRRSYTKKYPHFWSVPGVKQEQGETLEQTAIREVKEEIGLHFEPQELILSSENSGMQLNRFLGIWKGEVVIQEEEIDGYGWFTYEEIEKLEIAFDNMDAIKVLNQRGLL